MVSEFSPWSLGPMCLCRWISWWQECVAEERCFLNSTNEAESDMVVIKQSELIWLFFGRWIPRTIAGLLCCPTHALDIFANNHGSISFCGSQFGIKVLLGIWPIRCLLGGRHIGGAAGTLGTGVNFYVWWLILNSGVYTDPMKYQLNQIIALSIKGSLHMKEEHWVSLPPLLAFQYRGFCIIGHAYPPLSTNQQGMLFIQYPGCF